MTEAKLYKCQDCRALTAMDGTDVEPLYECNSCGTMFVKSNSADGESHRCPVCNKFASKVTDTGCVDCGEGELEVIDGYVCEGCDEAFEDENGYKEHLKDNPEHDPATAE
jgi:DNA-directed RNA polymerase subunit RPC12/RpoP